MLELGYVGLLCQVVRSRVNVSQVLRPEDRGTASGGLLGWLEPCMVRLSPKTLLEERVT
jgi:hypothetical protein